MAANRLTLHGLQPPVWCDVLPPLELTLELLWLEHLSPLPTLPGPRQLDLVHPGLGGRLWQQQGTAHPCIQHVLQQVPLVGLMARLTNLLNYVVA